VSEPVDLLTTHAFFAGMPAGLLVVIAQHATPMKAEAGTLIARAGNDADTFYAVLGGRVGIEVAAPGREPLVVSTVHAGELVGWSWFTGDHTWQFDVVALDDVRALAIDATAVRAACAVDAELDNQLSRRLLHLVASRLTATRYQLTDVYGRDH
jgi:CRP-like cAMP-binding protein